MDVVPYRIRLDSLSNKPVLACGSKVYDVFYDVEALLRVAPRHHLFREIWVSVEH